jgi:hypothetical protein
MVILVFTGSRSIAIHDTLNVSVFEVYGRRKYGFSKHVYRFFAKYNYRTVRFPEVQICLI